MNEPKKKPELPHKVKIKVNSYDPADIKVCQEATEGKAYPDTEISISMSKKGGLDYFDPQDIKVIFLDIDGVLNFAHLSRYLKESRNKDLILKHGKLRNYWNKYIEKKNPDFFFSKGGPMSRNAIRLLNELTDSTGAKIVVSSTWRKDTNPPIEETLKDAGITGEIIGITPSGGPMTCRGDEIYQWIKDNEELVGAYYKFKKYVILDDDSDMLLSQANNFVNTDHWVGMTEKTVFKAKRILGDKL